jgi:methionyl-tRNA formyltransferase
MNIIFMGTPNYAEIILRGLITEDDFNIVAVYTQPDRPVGRKQVLTPPDVKKAALEHNIEIYQPENINESSEIETIKSLKPDVIVVAAYGQLVKQPLLDIAPCINLHSSILPNYRGASPVQETLLNGDKLAGVTAMKMEIGMDSGDILGISYLTPKESAKNDCLLENLAYAASSLTKDVLRNFAYLSPTTQHRCDASYVKKRTKAESLVCFDNALLVDRKYRAFYPWPGIHLESKMKLLEIELESEEGCFQEGEILAIEKSHIKIACKRGILRVINLQPASKKAVNATAYLNGKRLGIGDILS